jgi:hypothetical protein
MPILSIAGVYFILFEKAVSFYFVLTRGQFDDCDSTFFSSSLMSEMPDTSYARKGRDR